MDVFMKFMGLIILLVWSQAWAKWSISSYNIRNFDRDPGAGQTDLVELEKIIKTTKSDVMTFQEVVNVEAFKELMKKALPSYALRISSCGGFGKQYLAVAYNPRAFKFVAQAEDLTFSGGRENVCGSLRPVFLVSLENLKENNDLYVFAVVHLKAGGDSRAFQQRWEQYKKLEGLSKAYARQNFILAGDFNTTGYNIKDQDFVRFEDLLSKSSLRTMTETLGCTNYWHGNLGGEEFIPSVLDHIVIQDKMLNKVESASVGAHCAKLDCRRASGVDLGASFLSVSDHCPIQVTFK
jgi:endonuclease/exonuclease/phosphatase family metal-dependent hydrolase